MSRSTQLKEDGNRHFQAGDYAGAESLYSQAILVDPKNPALFTNRAMARLKLDLWDSVTADCVTCIALAPNNMKAHYYLSQAQLALADYDSALESAQRAHQLCVKTNDRSLGPVTSLVLRCKRDRWQDRQKRLAREGQELEEDLVRLLHRQRDDMLDDEEMTDPMQREMIEEECHHKISLLRDLLGRARKPSEQQKQVPEWVIDDISFGVMVDPVMTKTGKSYERASIMEHLSRQSTDPLTREPLVAADLRPNLALRQACEDFLEENGWAVDW